MNETCAAIPRSTVFWLIIVNGMLEGVADHAPGQESEDGGGFESCVSAGGLRLGDLLLRRALEFDGCPRSGNGHEKVLTLVSTRSG